MRRSVSMLVIGILLTPAGCDSADGPGKIRDVDWAASRKSEANCLSGVTVAAAYHDLNADGADDAVLRMRCENKSDPQGDQLQVVGGAGDFQANEPTKLILPTPGTVIDQVHFAGDTLIYRLTAGRTPAYWQVTWSKDKPAPDKPRRRPDAGCA